MKNIVIGVLLAVSLVWGALYLQQSKKTRDAEETVASLRLQISDLQAQAAPKETTPPAFPNRPVHTPAISESKPVGISPATETPTNPPTAGTNAANAFTEMFKNPEMRKLIKEQQKSVLSGMIDKNYSGLFTNLHLSVEQSAALKDLIVNKSLVDADIGTQIMGGVDADQRKQLVDQAKTEKDALDARIKQSLGDDGYTQFQSYEKSIPERMTINMFKDSQGTGATALTADQEQQLLQTMVEERQNFKFTTDYTDQSKFTEDPSNFFTEEKLNQFNQENGQLLQRYLDRAQGTLSPDQLTSFQKFLTSQQQLQEMGLKMAMKMFAPQSGGK